MNQNHLELSSTVLCLNYSRTITWNNMGTCFLRRKYYHNSSELSNSLCIFGLDTFDFIWISNKIVKPNVDSRLTIRCAKTELI